MPAEFQYCRDEPAVDANDAITEFDAANATTDSFKIKEELTSKTDNNGTKLLK